MDIIANDSMILESLVLNNVSPPRIIEQQNDIVK